MNDFTHFDQHGNAIMVDVSAKEVTTRKAIATGTIHVSNNVLNAIMEHNVKKGDVLTVAQVAGIMATKRTSDLIPMCHPLSLTHVTITFDIDEKLNDIHAKCIVTTDGKTGVEMEALTGTTIALLTIYDMCKAIDRRMVIKDIHLFEKSGGKSGHFTY